jgi:hypothetical protein
MGRNKKRFHSKAHGNNDGGRQKKKRKTKQREMYDEVHLHCFITIQSFKLACMCKTDYKFKNGLRHVVPYAYEFRTHAKERWYAMQKMDNPSFFSEPIPLRYDQNLFSVFCKEFGSNSPDYFRQAIEDGRITVEKKSSCSIASKTGASLASLDYSIARGDCLVHVVHRHEPPVLADKVAIIHNGPTMLVSKSTAVCALCVCFVCAFMYACALCALCALCVFCVLCLCFVVLSTFALVAATVTPSLLHFSIIRSGGKQTSVSSSAPVWCLPLQLVNLYSDPRVDPSS